MNDDERSAAGDVRAAYAAGLRLLSGRDLSEAQLRERLARRHHPAPAIEAALVRLKAEGALDDRRVATGRARVEILVRGRGRLRALAALGAIGIPAALADEAVEDVLAGADEPGLVERALDRRMRGRSRTIADEAEFRRLYRFLQGQGFSTAAILPALRARARGARPPEDDV